MKKTIFNILLAVFCGSTLAVHAEDFTESSTGQSFPKEVSFNYEGKEYKLQATGAALRKKLIVKVYAVAHYLQDGAAKSGDINEAILSDQNAKQLTMKWLRAGSVEQIKSGYESSFSSTLSESEYAALKPDIEKFIAFFNEPAVQGDEQILRWIPGGTIEVTLKGKVVGTIKNPAFAKALWNLWFGTKSVVNRDNLVNLVNK